VSGFCCSLGEWDHAGHWLMAITVGVARLRFFYHLLSEAIKVSGS